MFSNSSDQNNCEIKIIFLKVLNYQSKYSDANKTHFKSVWSVEKSN